MWRSTETSRAGDPHAPAEKPEIDAGVAEAERLVSAIATGGLATGFAWSCFVELQARHGRHGPAVRRFVRGLAERAAQHKE